MFFILTTLASVIAICLPHMGQRSHILCANIGVAVLNAANMAMHGVMMGVLVYVLAMTGSFIQLVLPDDRSFFGASMRNWRMALAALLVCGGGFVLYSTPVDLIAVAAFTVARFAETNHNPLHIKQGFLLSGFFFLLFAVLNGVAATIVIQAVLITSLIAAIYLDMAKGPEFSFWRMAHARFAMLAR